MLSWVLGLRSHKAATNVAEFSFETQLGKGLLPKLTQVVGEIQFLTVAGCQLETALCLERLAVVSSCTRSPNVAAGLLKASGEGRREEGRPSMTGTTILCNRIT